MDTNHIAMPLNFFLVQMLTRVELMFLHKHSGYLDTTQRSLISHHSPDNTLQESGSVAGDGSQMSRLEKELAKKEQEDRQKSEFIDVALWGCYLPLFSLYYDYSFVSDCLRYPIYPLEDFILCLASV